MNQSLAISTHSSADITLGDLVHIYRRRQRLLYGVIAGAVLPDRPLLHRVHAALRGYSSYRSAEGKQRRAWVLDNLMSGPGGPGRCAECRPGSTNAV